MSSVSMARVDCRTWAAFCQGHHVDAGWIPVDELPMRMHELPDTNVSLIVYAANSDELQQANAFFTSKGYHVVQAITWTSSLAASLHVAGTLALGTQSQRLWQPAPLIARFVSEFMPVHQIQPGEGLDIGCGAGRDTIYLVMHGWRMTGIDRNPDALRRVQQLASRQHVTVTTLELDLETGQDPFGRFADAQFALITVARYLHRPLFPWLKRLLKPGGILIYQTFMQGAEQFGSPRNPNFLLKPGELAQVFAGMDILLDTVETLADGRPVSAFICRQVASCF